MRWFVPVLIVIVITLGVLTIAIMTHDRTF